MVGEYVGSQDHQHLVKYSRVTIIFYAAVDNASNDTCMPCEKAYSLFNKYDLDKVAIESIGKFRDYDKMCDALCHYFKEVAKSEIAKDEEGNVLYFISRGKNNKSRCLSLCKLKTLEYRLFRKMREKLRNFYASSTTSFTAFTKKSHQFQTEARELSLEHQLPRPLAYYCEVFQAAFAFIKVKPD